MATVVIPTKPILKGALQMKSILCAAVLSLTATAALAEEASNPIGPVLQQPAADKDCVIMLEGDGTNPRVKGMQHCLVQKSGVTSLNGQRNPVVLWSVTQ